MPSEQPSRQSSKFMQLCEQLDHAIHMISVFESMNMRKEDAYLRYLVLRDQLEAKIDAILEKADEKSESDG